MRDFKIGSFASRTLYAAAALGALHHVLRPLAALWVLAVPVLLAGCVTRYTPQAPERPPAEVRAELVRLMPAGAADREGWAAHIPDFMVTAALRLRSSDGRTYRERLKRVRTEKQLSALFQDFVGKVPLGRQLFGGFNPVHTGGPMQVSVDFAEAHAGDYPYPVTDSIRHEVFTRRGCMYFGIAHLLGYTPHYPEPLYRFADYNNAGWYAGRNAAFQSAVSQISGIPLALDGDLVGHGFGTPGQTERATMSLGDRLDMDDGEIRGDLRQGESPEFEDTDVYKRLSALADVSEGWPVPRAVLPGIELESPKITRKLTTAWFAHRVDTRWQHCMRSASRTARQPSAQ